MPAAYVPADAEDITDYGAVSNTSDPDDGTPSVNRQAIINAMDAAGDGGSIYVPPGTYHFGQNDGNSWIQLGANTSANGVSIYGDGADVSELKITQHTPAGNIATMFRQTADAFQQGTGAETMKLRGVKFNGNSQNLADDVTGIGINKESGNGDLTIDAERCVFTNITQTAIRDDGGDVLVDYCTFDRIGIKYENDTYGGGNDLGNVEHCVVPSPRASENDTVEITNCAFLTVSGNAADPGGDGTVIMSNCYGEGLGTGIAKVNNDGGIQMSNVYARMNTSKLETAIASNNASRPFDGRVAFYSTTGADVTADNCEFRDMTEQGIYCRESGSLTISGTDLALDGVGIKRDLQGEAIQENNSPATLDWNSFGPLSVHGINDTFTVFNTSNGGGTIDTLRWESGIPLGDRGATTITTEKEGDAPLQPTVPSRDEVGAFGGTTDPVDTTTTTFSSTFVDDVLGEDPPNTTREWVTSAGDFEVANFDSPFGDTVTELNPPGNDSRALSFDATGVADDTELFGIVKHPAYTEFSDWCRLYARGGGTNQSKRGYYCSFFYDTGTSTYQLRLAKFVDTSTPTQIGTRVDLPDTDNQYNAVLLRVSGDTIEVKTWPWGDAEPGSPQISETDTDLDTGWAGIGGFADGSQKFDYLGIGTGGLDAPRPESTFGRGVKQLTSSGVFRQVDDAIQTLPISVTVATNAATNVNSMSADVEATMATLEGYNDADVTIEYREATSGTWDFETSPTTLQEGDTVTKTITGLNSGTQYEFRATATGLGEGSVSDTGAIRTFTTDGAITVVDDYERASLDYYAGDTGGYVIEDEANVSFDAISGTRMLQATATFDAIMSDGTLPNGGISKGTAFKFYLYAPDMATNDAEIWTFFAGAPSTIEEGYAINLDGGVPSIKIQRWDSGTPQNLQTDGINSLNDAIWYRLEVIWDDGTIGSELDGFLTRDMTSYSGADNDISVELYEDATDELQASPATANDSTYATQEQIGNRTQTANIYWDFNHRP